MATLPLSADHAPPRADPIAYLRLIFRRRLRQADASDPQDSRQRRAFVGEMLSRNPGAFATADDVRAMMQFFPERF